MPENGKILLPKTCSVNVRRFLIAFTLIVLSATSYNQPLPGNFFGLGVTSFGMDTQLSSSVGIHASLGYAKFYIDISNNLATSKAFGSFSDGQTSKQDYLNAGVMNFGYIFAGNRFAVIPVIGWAWTGSLFRNPVFSGYWDLRESENKINFGIMVRTGITGNMGLHAGFGLHENFKTGLSYLF
jgi:hypothetical protein